MQIGILSSCYAKAIGLRTDNELQMFDAFLKAHFPAVTCEEIPLDVLIPTLTRLSHELIGA